MLGDAAQSEGYREEFTPLPAIGACEYSGNWRNGAPNGRGKLRFEDDSSFEGLFVKGLRDGLGTRTNKNGNQLSTLWKQDVM